MTTQPPAFLTAEWRHLVMLNYEIDPDKLQPFVPRGTELDTWQGRTYLSVVGFLFLNTRVRRLPIPFHTHFEEVNLRFYVRRLAPDGWRRGVVFIRELVPRPAIAWVARLLYNENYVALPMRHHLIINGKERRATYLWRYQNRWHHLGVAVDGPSQPLVPGSEAEFITEHYWGYARQRDGSTVEYAVEHPRWRIWTAVEASFEADVAALYGPQFVGPLRGEPTSAFLADGSAVIVRRGRRLEAG